MSPIISRAGFSLGFGGRRNVGGASVPISATGGNQTPANGLAPGNGYKYHTFTSPGTFTVSSGGNVELLLVGGGSAGATGAGGAGGLIFSTSIPVTTVSPYPITVGSGGVMPSTYHNDGPNYLGGPSTALGFTAATGGWGGAHTFSGTFTSGGPGASGGGGAPLNGGGAPYPGGPGTGGAGGTPGSVSPPAGWGNPGAPTQGGNAGPGGGGGGAGGASTSAAGGSGLAYPNFTGPLIGVPSLPGTYAVGGSSATPGVGAVSNTGNGGAGMNPQPLSSGGSGIVVIRYLV